MDTKIIPKLICYPAVRRLNSCNTRMNVIWSAGICIVLFISLYRGYYSMLFSGRDGRGASAPCIRFSLFEFNHKFRILNESYWEHIIWNLVSFIESCAYFWLRCRLFWFSFHTISVRFIKYNYCSIIKVTPLLFHHFIFLQNTRVCYKKVLP